MHPYKRRNSQAGLNACARSLPSSYHSGQAIQPRKGLSLSGEGWRKEKGMPVLQNKRSFGGCAGLLPLEAPQEASAEKENFPVLR